MWLLLMVLLNSVEGVSSTTLLNHFDSPGAYTDCMTERDRITADMIISYPRDSSFNIECREKLVAEPTKVEYDDIIKTFARSRYPKQALQVEVTNMKPLQVEVGTLPIMVLQIHVTHKDGVESFFLLIKNKSVWGWLDAGEAVEVTEDEEEIFSAKDQI